MVWTHQLTAAILLVLAGALLGARLLLHFGRAWRNLRMKRRFRRGERGEQRGLRYLRRHGFTVLAEQPSLKPSMEIDGQRREYTIRADFLVHKGRRRAVVDAKTGSCASDPAFSATRRQLLEYAYHYGVDDVYLYDGDRDTLRLVRFPKAGSRKLSHFFIFFSGIAAGFALAGALVLLAP